MRWFKLVSQVLLVSFPIVSARAQSYSVINPTDDTYICSAIDPSQQFCEAQNYDGNLLRADYQNQSYSYSTFIRFDWSDFGNWCTTGVDRAELVLTVHTPAGTPNINVVRWRHLGGWDWQEDSLTAQKIQEYINQYGWSVVRDFITTLSQINNPTVINVTSAFDSVCANQTPLTLSLEGDFSGYSYVLSWWDTENGAAGQRPFLRIYPSQNPDLPDLVVHSIVVDSAIIPKVRERFRVFVEVINIGQDTAPPNLADIRIDGISVHSWNIPSMAPGETLRDTLYVASHQSGQHLIEVNVDVTNVVDEVDEMNNSGTLPVLIDSYIISDEYSVWIGGEGTNNVYDFILGAITGSNGGVESFRVYLKDSISDANNVPSVDVDINDGYMYIASQDSGNGDATTGFLGIYHIGSQGNITEIARSPFPYIHSVYWDEWRDSIWVTGGEYWSNGKIRVYPSVSPFESTYREIEVDNSGQITHLLVSENFHFFISAYYVDSNHTCTRVLYFPYAATHDGFVDSTEYEIVDVECGTRQYLDIVQDIFGRVMYARMISNTIVHHHLIRLVLSDTVIYKDTVATLRIPWNVTIYGILGLTSSQNGKSRFLITTGGRTFVVEDDPYYPDSVDNVVDVDTIGGLYIAWHPNQPVKVNETVKIKPHYYRFEVVRQSSFKQFLRRFSRYGRQWIIYSAEGRKVGVDFSRIHDFDPSPGVYIIRNSQGHRMRVLVLP